METTVRLPKYVPVDKTIGKLTLHAVGRMTKAERKLIAQWLREQARSLEKLGAEYAVRFTASYIVPRKP